MEKVTGTESTIEVFENDIELYLHQFQEEQNIDDLRTVPQSVWNGALRYINRNVFKPNPNILKSNSIYNINNNNIPSNCNMYNYGLVNEVLDYYIYLCNVYNKECSIKGFSNLTGINQDTIHDWGKDNNKLSSMGCEIYKKLNEENEESHANRLYDGKQNPIGAIATLKHRHGWESPYFNDQNKGKQSLTAAELPKLGGNTTENLQIEQMQTVPEQTQNR